MLDVPIPRVLLLLVIRLKVKRKSTFVEKSRPDEFFQFLAIFSTFFLTLNRIAVQTQINLLFYDFPSGHIHVGALIILIFYKHSKISFIWTIEGQTFQ